MVQYFCEEVHDGDAVTVMLALINSDDLLFLYFDLYRIILYH